MRLALQIDTNNSIFETLKTKKLEKEYAAFLAEHIVSRLRTVVRRQLYNWSPLSKTWKAYKKEMGLSTKIWIASGQLIQSVKFWYSARDKAWIVGVHPRLLHKKYKKGGIYSTVKTKVKIIYIIRKLEYGNLRTPPRPLFTKVFDEFRYNQSFWVKKFLSDHK